MKRYISLLFPCLLAFCIHSDALQAQDNVNPLQPLIKLKNGSFEDTAGPGKLGGRGPKGWHDCGNYDETAPDIHPAVWPHTAYFQVTKSPSMGLSYVGMVVRENVTWEAIGQGLRTPLLAGKCYNFSIDLARSKKYVSSTKTSNFPVNYKKAAVLRVWGGNRYCEKSELLDETDAVENFDWLTYNLRLEPSRNYRYIMLEVFYKTPVFKEYNGNMLLDNASDLIPTPCDETPKPPIEEPKDELVASTTPINTSPNKPKKEKSNKLPKKEGKPKEEKANGKPEKVKKKYVKELDDEFVVGQEITLKKLYFKADSSSLNKEFYPIVDDVYAFLIENEKVVIEVGGHTNNRCEDVFCNRLSEERAESVANYLIGKGIEARRVKFQGYGRNNPKYSNNTPTNRRRNQRVEIKILSKG